MSSPIHEHAYIAFGGNLGEVLEAFRRALARLEQLGVCVLRVSSAYQTEALLAPGDTEPAPPYWNAVVEVRTQHSPHQLLEILQTLEKEAGRRSGSKRWASRPLDLDLLAYEGYVSEDATLQLPHPRMGRRVFVLRPMFEIAPDFVLVSEGRTIGELLMALPCQDQGILKIRAFWSEKPHRRFTRTTEGLLLGVGS